MSQPVGPSDDALRDSREKAAPAAVNTPVVQRTIKNRDGTIIADPNHPVTDEIYTEITEAFPKAQAEFKAVIDYLEHVVSHTNVYTLDDVWAHMSEEYGNYDWTSKGAFLQSVATLWGPEQGNLGCGMRDDDPRVLYLSNSGSPRPALYEAIMKNVTLNLPAPANRPIWSPMGFKPYGGWVLPTGGADSTGMHAEGRIMHVWGEKDCSKGIIRTNDPPCLDCHYLMGKFNEPFSSPVLRV
jgi:uncharacterized protein YozE (UPF0346 family)